MVCDLIHQPRNYYMHEAAVFASFWEEATAHFATSARAARMLPSDGHGIGLVQVTVAPSPEPGRWGAGTCQ